MRSMLIGNGLKTPLTRYIALAHAFLTNSTLPILVLRTAGRGCCQFENAMTKAFDFSVEAELFFAQRKYQRSAVGYRRFSYAAEAIRFAIEELPAGLLAGAFIEVDGERYGGDKIRSLYDSTDFPHPGRPTFVA